MNSMLPNAEDVLAIIVDLDSEQSRRWQQQRREQQRRQLRQQIKQEKILKSISSSHQQLRQHVMRQQSHTEQPLSPRAQEELRRLPRAQEELRRLPRAQQELRRLPRAQQELQRLPHAQQELQRLPHAQQELQQLPQAQPGQLQPYTAWQQQQQLLLLQEEQQTNCYNCYEMQQELNYYQNACARLEGNYEYLWDQYKRLERNSQFSPPFANIGNCQENDCHPIERQQMQQDKEANKLNQAREEELKSPKEKTSMRKTFFNNVTKDEKSKYNSAKKNRLGQESMELSKIGLNLKKSVTELQMDEQCLCSSKQTSSKFSKSSQYVKLHTTDDSTTFGDSMKSDDSSNGCISPLLKKMFFKSEKIVGLNDSKKSGSQSSIDDAFSGEDSTVDSDTNTKRRVLELEKENSQLRNRIKEMTMRISTLLAELNKPKKVEPVPVEKEPLPIRSLDVTSDNKQFEAKRLWSTLQMNGVSKQVTQQTSKNKTTSLLAIAHDNANNFSSSVPSMKSPFSEEYNYRAQRDSNLLVYHPIGIHNPRGTFCYMISVVQALSNLPCFALSPVLQFGHKEGDLLHAMFQIYKCSWIRETESTNSPRYNAVIDATELRNYYSHHRSDKFDPARQHDADEFLCDLISTMETEVAEKSIYANEKNPISNLFRGYILSANGTHQEFLTLRLSITDERIDSVRQALIQHLVLVPHENTDSQPVPSKKSTSSKIPIKDGLEEERITKYHSTATNGDHDKHSNLLDKTNNWGQLQSSEINFPSVGIKRNLKQEKTPDECGNAERQKNTKQLCNSDRNEISSGDKIYVGNKLTEKYRKIFTPEILCVSLDRYDSNLNYNAKVISPDDLVIPAELRVAEGNTGNAFYKLMSVVQYIRMDSTSGHYYTFVKIIGKNGGYMLNDGIVSAMKGSSIDLATHGGQASIFVYLRTSEK